MANCMREIDALHQNIAAAILVMIFGEAMG